RTEFTGDMGVEFTSLRPCPSDGLTRRTVDGGWWKVGKTKAPHRISSRIPYTIHPPPTTVCSYINPRVHPALQVLPPAAAAAGMAVRRRGPGHRLRAGPAARVRGARVGDRPAPRRVGGRQGLEGLRPALRKRRATHRRRPLARPGAQRGRGRGPRGLPPPAPRRQPARAPHRGLLLPAPQAPVHLARGPARDRAPGRVRLLAEAAG